MMRRRIALALWCVLAGALYVFENNAATRSVLAASVVVPAVGAVWAWISARRVRCGITAPDRARRGDNVDICVDVRGVMPGTAGYVELTCVNLFTREQAREEQPLKRGRIHVQLSAQHCGMLRLEARAVVQDWCGICGMRTCASAESMTYVPPSELDLPCETADAPAAYHTADAVRHIGGMDGSDMVSVREYMPGDPVRLMHWKLSQKTDMLLLREMESFASSELTLVFDASQAAQAEDMPSCLDAMAAVMLALSRQAVQSGRAHRVLWQMQGSETMTSRQVVSMEDVTEMEAAFFSAGVSLEEAPPRLTAEDVPSQVILIGSDALAAQCRAMGCSVTVYAQADRAEEESGVSYLRLPVMGTAE